MYTQNFLVTCSLGSDLSVDYDLNYLLFIDLI